VWGWSAGWVWGPIAAIAWAAAADSAETSRSFGRTCALTPPPGQNLNLEAGYV
jgi:hypothetical protein